MTMQYIEGFTLFDWLKDNPQRDVGLVLDILKKICGGLDFAHRMGTFHRDIKPANIMMTKRGDLYLVDFGLAKLVGGMGNITRLGGAGTPNYMSPEQRRGGEIDQRSDIYSVGVLSYEMFTGELPKLTMASQLNAKLNEGVDKVLVKSMASNPSDRYSSILSFIEDLEDALQTKKVSPRYQGASPPRETTVSKGTVEPDTSEPMPQTKPETIVDMSMVTAGHFWMGSSLDESKNESEKPRHRVFLGTYYMDKYPVTNQAYRRFLRETGHPQPLFWADPQFNHPSHPVVALTWYDALAYCNWANKRLPTEAEWEKVAKGEANFIYPWGNEFKPGMANVDAILSHTSPVDQFSMGISPYGCFDMIGNAWEWCYDWFDEKFYTMSPANNPNGPENGKKKVIRGGGWDTISFNARNAFRFFADPASKSPNIGFRCVVDA
jgi:iron(II)-dependent oxidoreductase